MRIVALTGLSYPTVRKTLDAYRAGDFAALLPRSRGRRVGEGRSLSGSEERRVCEQVDGAAPVGWGLDEALWSRASVARLIERTSSLTLSARGLDNYLARWGYAVPRRARGLCGHCAGAPRQWMREAYPLLQRRVREAAGEIQWIGMQPLPPQGLRFDGAGGGHPATRGVAELQWMLMAVSNRGLVRWLVTPTPWRSDALQRLLQGLALDVGRKVFALLDVRSFPAFGDLGGWLAGQVGRLEVLSVPACPIRPPDCRWHEALPAGPATLLKTV